MKLTVGDHVFDLSRKTCDTCGRAVRLVRARTRRNYWQHTGDGLAQYRSWHV